MNSSIIVRYYEHYCQGNSNTIKGAISGLRQFLAIDSPFKAMINAFYFTSKTIFLFKIFKFLFSLFGHLEKRLD